MIIKYYIIELNITLIVEIGGDDIWMPLGAPLFLLSKLNKLSVNVLFLD